MIMLKWHHWIPSQARTRIITLTVIALYCAEIAAYEATLVPESSLSAYLATKWPLIALIAVAIASIWRWPASNAPNHLTLIALFLYSIGSSFFRSFYILSLLEFGLLFFFVFPHSLRVFWAFSIGAFALHTIILTLRWPSAPEYASRLALLDHHTIAAQFATITLLLYFLFIRAKKSREEQDLRFISIGRKAARITHDIKGLMAAPRLYLGRAEELLAKKSEPAELREIIARLEKDLEAAQASITELYQMARGEKHPKEWFSVAEVIRSLQGPVQLPGRKIDIQVEGDLRIHGSKSLFSSAIFNMLTNGIAALERSKQGPRWMCFKIDPQAGTIIYEDSGGGFNAGLLRRIQEESTDGLGMGIKLMQDCAKNFRGSATFANGRWGAEITLTMPLSATQK